MRTSAARDRLPRGAVLDPGAGCVLPFAQLSMWVPARQLVSRLRQPRSRAEERGDVARRLRAEARASAAPPEERRLAARLRACREAMAGILADVRSCASCATGCVYPHGAFAGGACCGTETHRVFSDEEVAALAAGGTRPRHLTVPAGEHAGCAFRGPSGCSLRAADRPNACIRYVCYELSRELYAAGRLEEVENLAETIQRAFEDLSALREARRERQWLADIHPALAEPAPDGKR